VANETPSAESKEKPVQAKKKGKLLFIIIGVVALVGAAAGGAFAAKMMMSKQPAAPKEVGTPEDPGVTAAKEEVKGGHGETAAKETPKEAAKGAHGEAAASGGHGEAAKEAPAKGGHGGGEEGKGEGKEGKGKPEDDGPPVYKLSKPIMTNLKGSPQKVYASIWIEATSKENVEVIRKSEYLIMDKLVFVFSGKSKEDLTSQEGLELLQKEIKVRLDDLLGAGKIKRVGFDGSVNVI
jgi:flagellar basal body-associated protein FliL